MIPIYALSKGAAAAVVALAMAVICSSAPVSAGAQATEVSAGTTYGMINGNLWAELNTGERIGFLRGAADIMAAVNSSQRAQYFPDEVGITEIKNGVDRFYADPANQFIPAIQAVRIFIMRITGESQSAVDIRIASERKVALKAPERQ